MSKKERSVARRLFHCARALGHALDAAGPVPMSPDGFGYEGGTVVYQPPVATNQQLCVAPELSRPGTQRDARSVCYEAAMCVRAHLEGAGTLERLLLDVGPEADRAAAWDEWLRDSSRAVPPPPKSDYAELDDALEILRSWTQRDPQERRMKADGWHALAKAVLKDVPDATEPTEPVARGRVSPLVLRAGLVALMGLTLGVLLGLLLGPKPAPPPVEEAAQTRPFENAILERPYRLTLRSDHSAHGQERERSVDISLRHARIVLDEEEASGNTLSLSVESDTVLRMHVLLGPASGPASGPEKAAEPTQVPGMPLTRRAPGQTEDQPVPRQTLEDYRQSLGDDRGSATPALGLEGDDSSYKRIESYQRNRKASIYRLASDRGLPSNQVLVARIIFKEGRTIDITVGVGKQENK